MYTLILLLVIFTDDVSSTVESSESGSSRGSGESGSGESGSKDGSKDGSRGDESSETGSRDGSDEDGSSTSGSSIGSKGGSNESGTSIGESGLPSSESGSSAGESSSESASSDSSDDRPTGLFSHFILAFLVLLDDLSTDCPLQKYVDDTTLSELVQLKQLDTHILTYLAYLLIWEAQNGMEINTCTSNTNVWLTLTYPCLISRRKLLKELLHKSCLV